MTALNGGDYENLDEYLHAFQASPFAMGSQNDLNFMGMGGGDQTDYQIDLPAKVLD